MVLNPCRAAFQLNPETGDGDIHDPPPVPPFATHLSPRNRRTVSGGVPTPRALLLMQQVCLMVIVRMQCRASFDREAVNPVAHTFSKRISRLRTLALHRKRQRKRRNRLLALTQSRRHHCPQHCVLPHRPVSELMWRRRLQGTIRSARPRQRHLCLGQGISF